MARYEHAANAHDASLVSDITASATSLVISGPTNWPTGGTYKFWVVIDPDNDSEEHILGNARSGSSITLASVSDRGKEGTTAVAHRAGAVVRHIWSATEADDLALQSVANTFAAAQTFSAMVTVTGGTGTTGLVALGSNNVQVTNLPASTVSLGYDSQQVNVWDNVGNIGFRVFDKVNGSKTRFQIVGADPAAGGTSMNLLVNSASGVVTSAVTLGASDSGGTGYKVLRVPN